MSRRNWKRVQPTSLRHALELCKDFARDKHNLSVERIAERMGLADHWTLYKWLANGRLPANLIRPFEFACGCDFVTRWLAASAGKFVIDIPTGRKSSAQDIHALQEAVTDAVGKVLSFYSEKVPAEEAIAAITSAMEGLGFHHHNIQKHTQPELGFDGDDQ